MRPPYQQRIVQEQTDLCDKIALLEAFISPDGIWVTLPPAEQERMTRQLTHMREYARALGDRIHAFPHHE